MIAHAQGAWQSSSVQDARELAVRAPSIVFASTRGVSVPSLRFSFRDHLSLVGRRKYRTRCDCHFARHISHPSSTSVFFSSGLSGENAPVHRQRLASAASVRSKKKTKVQRRTDIRHWQQWHEKFQRASKNSCRLGVTETIITLL